MEGLIFIDSQLVKQVQEITCRYYTMGDLVSLEQLFEMIRDLVEVIQDERERNQ